MRSRGSDRRGHRLHRGDPSARCPIGLPREHRLRPRACRPSSFSSRSACAHRSHAGPRRADRLRDRPLHRARRSMPVSFWANPGDARVEFLHSFLLIALPYLGLVLGAKHGEWLEPARLVGLFRAAGAGAALQDSRHERDHRRPHRRRLRDRLRRRHPCRSRSSCSRSCSSWPIRPTRSSAIADAAASTSSRRFRRWPAST